VCPLYVILGIYFVLAIPVMFVLILNPGRPESEKG